MAGIYRQRILISTDRHRLSPGTSRAALRLRVTSFYKLEDVLDGDSEGACHLECQVSRGDEDAVLDGVDRFPGDPDAVCQLFLGPVHAGPLDFEGIPELFHSQGQLLSSL
jgi:hypothetical protein